MEFGVENPAARSDPVGITEFGVENPAGRSDPVCVTGEYFYLHLDGWSPVTIPLEHCDGALWPGPAESVILLPQCSCFYLVLALPNLVKLYSTSFRHVHTRASALLNGRGWDRTICRR